MAPRGRPKGSVDRAFLQTAVSVWLASEMKKLGGYRSGRDAAPRIAKALRQHTSDAERTLSAEHIRKMCSAVNKRRKSDEDFRAYTTKALANLIEIAEEAKASGKPITIIPARFKVRRII